MKPRTILFARPLREDGIYSEEDDIAESWCLEGYVDQLLASYISLMAFQPRFSVP